VKLLFLEDVYPTARAGDVKEVKSGFARNFLIPKKLAVIATTHELNRAKKLREEAEKRRNLEKEEWKSLISDVEKNTIEIEVRTGPTGRLYGSVTNAMIADKLENVINRNIDKKIIKIQNPIRTIGEYKIPANFFEDVSAELTISVIPDEFSEIISEDEKAIQDDIKTDAKLLDPTFEDVLKTSKEDITLPDSTEEILDDSTKSDEDMLESDQDSQSSKKNIDND
jgi:large subunit ribosomal protein L9